MNFRADHGRVRIEYQTIFTAHDQITEPDILEVERVYLRQNEWKTHEQPLFDRYIHGETSQYRLVPKYLLGDPERF